MSDTIRRMTADDTPLRLFLALWPDDSSRQALLAWRDAWEWPAGASPIRPERLHMTLHFIGPVPAARLGEVVSQLERPSESFTLDFGRAELWPHGIAVVCPLVIPSALRRLHGELGEALRRLDLPLEERALRPHVTLARRAHGALVPSAGPAVRWDLKEGYALVQSMPRGEGYRVLHRFG